MSAWGVELVDLVARWVHLIAGIMWVGNSLLWNWIDRNLVAPGGEARSQTPAPIGSIWLLHSGAFYYMEKTLLAGAPMPQKAHWFRTQAYTTWWSGFVLLLAVYWVGGRAAMTDPAVSAISHNMAVLVGVGGILAGGLVYEFAHRVIAPRAPRLATVKWIVSLAFIAFVFTYFLSARAAFLHVGAMLGTIMAGNVVFTIMPAQRELVAALAATGGAPTVVSAASARAKRVSVDNNYFVFPVIALMMTAHFSALYSAPRPWLTIAIIIAGGAAVRHLLNIRFTFASWRPLFVGALLATTGALYAVLQSGANVRQAPATSTYGPIAFADVRHVIDRRCGSCHAAEPSDVSFGVNPGGVRFDTPDQIIALASRIQERAIATRTMPPANKTMMTDLERELLARWISAGALREP